MGKVTTRLKFTWNREGGREDERAALRPGEQSRSRAGQTGPGPEGGAVTPPLFSPRAQVIERKGEPRRGCGSLPGSLENNLKGTGLSSSFSYGNATIDERGRGGRGKPFHSLKRSEFFPLAKGGLEHHWKAFQFAKLLHSLTAWAGGGGVLCSPWGVRRTGHF